MIQSSANHDPRRRRHIAGFLHQRAPATRPPGDDDEIKTSVGRQPGVCTASSLLGRRADGPAQRRVIVDDDDVPTHKPNSRVNRFTAEKSRVVVAGASCRREHRHPGTPRRRRRGILIGGGSRWCRAPTGRQCCLSSECLSGCSFLPRDAVLERYTLRPCVCPSVCASVCHKSARNQIG